MDLAPRKALKHRRLALKDTGRDGGTLEQLAPKIGVSAQTLWRWEEGKSAPHPVFLATWRHTLDKLERSACDGK